MNIFTRIHSLTFEFLWSVEDYEKLANDGLAGEVRSRVVLKLNIQSFSLNILHCFIFAPLHCTWCDGSVADKVPGQYDNYA